MLTPSMDDIMTSLSARRKKLIANRVRKEGYSMEPYSSTRMFVEDVAAISSEYPREMERHTAKNVTVANSLRHATLPTALEYLFNNTRFIARNEGVDVVYGTTRNEAFHRELKGFFANVRCVRIRRAQLIGEIVTLAKLVAGAMVRTRTTSKKQPVAVKTRGGILFPNEQIGGGLPWRR